MDRELFLKRFSLAIKIIHYTLALTFIGFSIYYAAVPAEDSMQMAKRMIGVGRLGLILLLFTIIDYFLSDYRGKR